MHYLPQCLKNLVVLKINQPVEMHKFKKKCKKKLDKVCILNIIIYLSDILIIKLTAYTLTLLNINNQVPPKFLSYVSIS